MMEELPVQTSGPSNVSPAVGDVVNEIKKAPWALESRIKVV